MWRINGEINTLRATSTDEGHEIAMASDSSAMPTRCEADHQPGGSDSARGQRFEGLVAQAARRRAKALLIPEEWRNRQMKVSTARSSLLQSRR